MALGYRDYTVTSDGDYVVVSKGDYSVRVHGDKWVAWNTYGKLIQNAMPDLTAEQREFLISGTTPDEWAAMFGTED